MTFEEAMARLTQIAAEIEKPDITLKNAIALYSEAVELKKICEDSVKDAKLELERVEK